MLMGEQTGTTGHSWSSISAIIAHWRSYRHIHRIALVIFVLLTIFVLERYRTALASTFQTSSETRDPIAVPGGNSAAQQENHYEPYPEATNQGGGGKHEEETQLTPEQLLELSQTNAGNSTLGFHAIKYINMKARYDREDAMALQAYMSGLDIEDYPAVEADMIDPVGMPPTHRPGKLKTGEKGCWRAHANVCFSSLLFCYLFFPFPVPFPSSHYDGPRPAWT